MLVPDGGLIRLVPTAAGTVLERRVREGQTVHSGDVLFVLSNLARKLDIDPGSALRAANAKFERRFRWMELRGQPLAGMPLKQQEALWSLAREQDHEGRL